MDIKKKERKMMELTGREKTMINEERKQLTKGRKVVVEIIIQTKRDSRKMNNKGKSRIQK